MSGETPSAFDPESFAREVEEMGQLSLDQRLAALEVAEARLRKALEEQSSRA